MHLRKTPEEKQRSNYKEACGKGYCPSLAERENSRISELTNRLKSMSDRETLTNVLDWQNTNVVFWFERYPLSQAIWVPLLCIFAISPIYITFRAIWFWCLIILLSVSATSSLIAIYMIRSYRRLPLKQIVNSSR
jgi:hypothetical protein